VYNSSDLRRWAFKDRLVRPPDAGRSPDEPDEGIRAWIEPR
jgi:hypothetical protein